MKHLMWVLLGWASLASAAEVPVVVRLNQGAKYGMEVCFAKMTVTKMFAGAGITLKWRPDPSAVTIEMLIEDQASEDDHPGALGFALPFCNRGTLVHIFANRIHEGCSSREFPCLLAHVMAHEITHVLEGTLDHTAAGIMKSKWNAPEIAEMTVRPMTFTAHDIFLIHAGLRHRATLTASR